MSRFNAANLLEKTKIMHDTQNKCFPKNWKDSLVNNDIDINELIPLIEVFDYWKIQLHKNEATKTLSKEIYVDAYMSIHLACFGLYKIAYMSLRSQFETAMRLIYFSNHLFEFSLWQNGDEKWIRDLLRGGDVWGDSFKYFGFIQEVKVFENSLTNNLKLISGNEPKLKSIYSILSKYVHSGGPYLQTRSGNLAPKYNQIEF